MKGWYIPTRPDEPAGETTAWYASYWEFCAAYLTDRFGQDWSLSPEQSLMLHAGNRTVLVQLIVRSSKARNQVTNFPHGTSMLEIRAALPEGQSLAQPKATACSRFRRRSCLSRQASIPTTRQMPARLLR